MKWSLSRLAPGASSGAGARFRRACAASRRRPTRTAALIYAVLSLAFVAPSLAPGQTLSPTDLLYARTPWSAVAPPDFDRPANPELYDPATQYIPWLEYSRNRLGQGLLWNPYIGAGRPYLADMQSAIVSPFSLPSYVLPFWWSLGLVAALKLFVACLGTFVLARRRCQGGAGALLAGLAYGFGLYLTVHLLYPFASVYALTPWLLVAIDRLVARPGPVPAAATAAVAAGCLTAGHPESAFHAFVLALIYAAWRLAAHARAAEGRAKLGPAVAWLAGAACTACALAAVALLPFTELLLNSADWRNRTDLGVSPRIPLRWAAGIVMPGYFGDPTDVSGDRVGLFVSRALYAGALPLMLALVAAVTTLRHRAPTRERGARLLFAAVAAVALAVAFGVPGLRDAAGALPFFRQANNTRLAVVYLLALALLAGFGLEDLRTRRAGRAALWIAGAVALVPVAVVVARTPASAIWDGIRVAGGLADPVADAAIARGRALASWTLAAGASLCLVVWALRTQTHRSFVAPAAAILTTLDLFASGAGFNPAIDATVAAVPATPVIRVLRSHRPARFAGLGDSLSPDLSMRFGLLDARAYDFPVVRRYEQVWRRYVFPLGYAPGTPQLALGVTRPSLRILGMLGVRDILAPHDLRAFAARYGTHPGALLPPGLGLRQTYDAPDGRLYRNPDALPRAFVVHAQHVVATGAAALQAVGDPSGPDLRSTVITERPIPGLPAGGSKPSAGGSQARIVRWSAQETVIDTLDPRPGLAVVSDVHYPGWSATVDGRAVPIRQVDYLLRGVSVPAGRHQIVMRYEPTVARVGTIISIGALAAMLAGAGLAGLAARRHRRRGASTATVAHP